MLLFLLLPASSTRRPRFCQHPVLEIISCCCFVFLYHCTPPDPTPCCCSDETLFPDVEVASCFVQLLLLLLLCTQLSAADVEPMKRLRKGKEKKKNSTEEFVLGIASSLRSQIHTRVYTPLSAFLVLVSSAL